MKVSTILNEQLRDSKHVKRAEKAVINDEEIKELIFDKIFDTVGPELAGYFRVEGIKLGFDWDKYEDHMRKKK